MPPHQPVRISATLPTLGTVGVDFYNESAGVLDFVGSRELRRLRDVAHLGVATSVFTGVNHSRLEYLLVQCAVVGLIGKLHKDNENLALSGKVQLDGIRSKISSAQEVLKIWAILSNYGHTQHTYGIERSFLQLARRERAFAQWLTRNVRQSDICDWAQEVIRKYQDENMHFVIALARISHGAPYDRRKSLMVHYLRNLLLPPETLFPNNAPFRLKLIRLREVFRNIRLLSMVALDSYYASYPIRFDLNAAISNLPGFTSLGTASDRFDQVLNTAGGWLADELYLHPNAVAVQREYEIRAAQVLPSRFARVGRDQFKSRRFLNELVFAGLGSPRVGELLPLVRLSFNPSRGRWLRLDDLFEVLKELENALVAPPNTEVSIDQNPFTKVIHVDVLFRRSEATPTHVADVYIRLRQWLTRSVEIEALRFVRDVMPGPLRAEEGRGRAYRTRFIARMLQSEAPLLAEIFYSFIRYVLPEHWSGTVMEFVPRQNAVPILARISDSSGTLHNFIGPFLDEQIDVNPTGLSADRLQELRALRSVVENSRAPLVLVCPERFVIRDQYGKERDDWDGTIVEISDDGVWLTVVEAKNYGLRTKNESKAFEQLAETRTFVQQRHRLPYRRTRITGLGAYIRFQLA